MTGKKYGILGNHENNKQTIHVMKADTLVVEPNNDCVTFFCRLIRYTSITIDYKWAYIAGHSGQDYRFKNLPNLSAIFVTWTAQVHAAKLPLQTLLTPVNFSLDICN